MFVLEQGLGRCPERHATGRTQGGHVTRAHQMIGGITMKLIEAIIKPFKLDEVKDALIEIGVHGRP